jgi:polysaccharide export outer membrane protein
MAQPGVLFILSIALSTSPAVCAAPQTSASGAQGQAAAAEPRTEEAASYILGPDDVIAIKALDAEEITSTSIRIDPSGFISLPMLGRVTAGGFTVERLEKELSTRLKTYVREPVVAVSIVEYRSQPVSVIGSVGQPGVHQLEGRKTLVEILAKAGGVRPEAGNTINITRKAEWGPIPLPSAVKDPSGQFTVAQVSLRSILQATNPAENILIKPNDVIAVPRGALVYVIGEVKKAGGFVLSERSTISGLQALAMADGMTSGAAPQKAIIIRQPPGEKRVEIAANLKEILAGKSADVELQPDDILFVPAHVAKNALIRTVQTAIQATTSAVIYRGIY